MFAVVQARPTLAHTLPKQGVGVEIGVFKGEFSDLLLRIARPKTLHLVDPWRASGAEEHRGALYSQAQRSQTEMDEIFAAARARFDKAIHAGQVVVHRESSEVAMETFADGSLDFVYIDGDHNERAVAIDLELAFRKVKPNGLICGDDYALGGWWGAGVIRAVNRFLGERFDKLAIVFVGDGQFMLRKLMQTG